MKTEKIVKGWVNRTVKGTSDTNSKVRKRSFLNEDSDETATGGVFLGEDTSDPSAEGIAIFEDPNNLPTAVASILNYCQTLANFHPASQTQEEISDTYAAYVDEVDKTPFFILSDYTSTEENFQSTNYDALIEAVVDMYGDLSEGDVDQIANSIANMAASVFGDESSEAWMTFFSQMTMDNSDGEEMKYSIMYTTLHMKYENDGKSEVIEQEYVLAKTDYVVLDDLIHAYAKELEVLVATNVTDWIDGISTPISEKVICFDKRNK